MAEYIVKNFDVEKLIFIPAKNPPQKDSTPELAHHRYEMVKLAIEDNSQFEISDIEYKREGKSYTYLTIQELYKEYKINGKINFVIGTDAFENLDSWYESEKLRELVEFIVFVRKDDFDENKYKKMRQKGYNFRFAKMEFHDISSTKIRRRINENEPLCGLVPEKIERYIKENELYKD